MLPRYGPGSLKVAFETPLNGSPWGGGVGLPNKKCSSCVYMSVVKICINANVYVYEVDCAYN